MLRKNILIKGFILLFILLQILSNNTLFAQKDRYLNNYYNTGTKKSETDTTQSVKAQEIAKESSGILEKEINPDKYILGRNDVFSISIIGVKTISFDAIISPEGKLLIPDVGLVDLKGKTLSDAYLLIKDRINKVFKTKEIYIVLKKLREFKVVVSGHVQSDNVVTATAVDRVSEVIEKSGGFKYGASIRKIVLYRNESKEKINVDLMKYFFLNNNDFNPTVLGGDFIFVPKSNEEETISISGEVPSPGTFEYNRNDSLLTLIKFAQGFLISSNLDSVEIARFRENSPIIDRWDINLSGWKNRLDTSTVLDNNIPLKVGDRVYIRQKSNWKESRDVVVTGEVNFPGKYAVNRDEMTVKDIIDRAGGYTDEGSIESTILIRQKEINKKDPEMERLSRIPYSEMSKNEQRYFQARISEQKGLMALNFKKIMNNKNSDDNIVVIDEDSIFVPKKKNFVNIQGRVNNPGLIIYNPNYTYLDYISHSGGFGFRADEDETLIVKSKGEQYLAKDRNYIIEPGDNILVPPKSETTFYEIFAATLTVTAQILTILGVILALRRL